MVGAADVVVLAEVFGRRRFLNLAICRLSRERQFDRYDFVVNCEVDLRSPEGQLPRGQIDLLSFRSWPGKRLVPFPKRDIQQENPRGVGRCRLARTPAGRHRKSPWRTLAGQSLRVPVGQVRMTLR
jgi:hypothetical protein